MPDFIAGCAVQILAYPKHTNLRFGDYGYLDGSAVVIEDIVGFGEQRKAKIIHKDKEIYIPLQALRRVDKA